jgi:hypothetical protein
MDIIFDKESNIAISTEKPEKLSDDSLPVDFFRREKWESIFKVKAKLTTKKAIRHISTSEIFVIDTVFDELSTEIEILLFWVNNHKKRALNNARIIRKIAYKAKAR